MKTQTEEKRMVAFRPIYLAAAIVGCLSLAGCPDFNLLDKQYPGDVRTHDTGPKVFNDANPAEAPAPPDEEEPS